MKSEMTNWIKCSERLPEDDREVLVRVQGRTKAFNALGYLDKKRWFDSVGFLFSVPVIAWCEIPEWSEQDN